MDKKWHQSPANANYVLELGYNYNERGWLTAMNNIPSGGNFWEQVYYNSPTGSTTIPQYNGNISQFIYNSPYMEQNNHQSLSSSNTVNYTYDNLNRLTQSVSNLQQTDETVSYDAEGNIKTLTRNGLFADDNTYTYPIQSNLLTLVATNTHGTISFLYDGNGNTTTDSTSKTISYNLLNLPMVIKKGSATLATYTYAADGEKLRDVSTSYGKWDYVNGIVYINGKIAFIQNAEGRNYLASDSVNYNYTYDIKDYLGNVRGSFDNGGTGGTYRLLQENDYYPFGLTVKAYDYSNGNRYLYNKKEEQLDLPNKFDYGKRYYDAYISRWMSIDPMADEFHRWNQYGYVNDNPTMLVDPDGSRPYDPHWYFYFTLGTTAINAAVNIGAANKFKGLYLVAQRRVENGFKLTPPGNNPMNIQGQGDLGQIKEWTHEDTKKGRVFVQENFAAFSSVEKGFGGYLDLLKRNYTAAYSDVIDDNKTITDFANDLKSKGKYGPYATDVNYVHKIETNFNSVVSDYTKSTTTDILENIKTTTDLKQQLIDPNLDAGQRVELETQIADQKTQQEKLWKDLTDLAKIK
jgi:RHS repeat-associated protein